MYVDMYMYMCIYVCMHAHVGVFWVKRRATYCLVNLLPLLLAQAVQYPPLLQLPPLPLDPLDPLPFNPSRFPLLLAVPPRCTCSERATAAAISIACSVRVWLLLLLCLMLLLWSCC